MRTHSCLSQANKRLEDMNCQRGRRGIWFSPRRLDHSMTSCVCPGKDACGYRVAVDSQTKVCWGYPAKHRHRQARLLARETQPVITLRASSEPSFRSHKALNGAGEQKQV